MIAPAGILLPESVLQSGWFSILATFVAVNTVIYVVLSVSKLFPVVRTLGFRKRKERAETRSIYPEGFVAVEASAKPQSTGEVSTRGTSATGVRESESAE